MANSSSTARDRYISIINAEPKKNQNTDTATSVNVIICIILAKPYRIRKSGMMIAE